MTMTKSLEDVSIADVKAGIDVSAAIHKDIDDLVDKWKSLAESAAEHHTINAPGLIGVALMEAGIGALIMARFPKEQIEKAAWHLAKFYTDPAAMAQIASFAEPDSEFAAHIHHLLQTQTTKKVAN